MQYVYVAQLEAGRVIGVSMLKKENFEQKENQIIIESLDESLLAMQYDSETNSFIQPT
jgi:hypothetical protein